jgi:3-oxoacyl-[acyl-carrier protein] reductase
MESYQDQISIARLRHLSDRVVIVTGAGQGIRRPFAKGLAAAGAIPVIIDIDRQKGPSVVKEIEALGGLRPATKGDVSAPASVEKMVTTAMDAFGRIDGLVNNAAMFSTLEMRSFEAIPLEEWCKVFDINVTGLMFCCTAVVPHMKEAKRGRGEQYFVGIRHYDAAKLSLLYDFQSCSDRTCRLDGARGRAF